MSKPTTIRIDDVEYVRADAAQDTNGPVKIAVLDRGFVYVGRLEGDEASGYVMTNAKNIRKWGTSRGLGELVNGPRPETLLDPVGTVSFAARAVIHFINVVESKWTDI